MQTDLRKWRDTIRWPSIRDHHLTAGQRVTPHSPAPINPNPARTLTVRIAFSTTVNLRGACVSAVSASSIFVSLSILMIRNLLFLLVLNVCADTPVQRHE